MNGNQIIPTSESNPDPGYLSSRGRGWVDSLSVDVYRRRPNFHVRYPSLDTHLLAFILSGTGRLHQQRSNRQHNSVLCADDMLLRPAFEEAVWTGDAPAHLRIRISSTAFDRAWNEFGSLPCRSAELASIFRTRDPLLANMAPIFHRELMAPDHPCQQLLTESAMNMVIAHLIRTYCAFAGKPEPKRVELAPHLTRRVCEYIEHNAGMTLTLTDLAGIAGVSPFHFCRAFRETTGLTPMRFLEQSRIRHAQALIEQGELSLKEVSATVGYKDQSHFSRKFRALAKCTPSEYARGRVPSEEA